MSSTCFLCFYVLVFNILIILTLAGQNKYSRRDDLKENLANPYWNYLNTPRLHFIGKFKADVSTVNNNFKSFDSENFIEQDEDLLSWNPQGTGEFGAHGYISQVCYYNGTCVVDSDLDPIIKQEFIDGGTKVSAKMVDLDTQAQIYTEMWGWRIQIGNYFSADYTPSPLQYIWEKKVISSAGPVRGDARAGAAYQSELTNIKWNENKTDSAFIKELRFMMANDSNIDSNRLSIRFNVDSMGESNYGRIAGSIGLMGIKSPTFYSHGRFVKALTSLTQDAPFVVDQRSRKVVFDFGNSFQFDEKGHFNVSVKTVYVAVVLEGKASTCNGKVFWLGRVNYHRSSWYRCHSGIQALPELGKLSLDEIEIANSHPLVVMEVTGEWPTVKCKRVLMAEPDHGVDIHPHSKWVARKNPPEKHEFRVFVTKFGTPLPRQKVHFILMCRKGDNVHPKICTPSMHYSSSSRTNKDGIATLKIWTRDPENPRKFIDGQFYQFFYYVDGYKPDIDHLRKNRRKYDNMCLALRVFNHFVPHSPPTWLDDIYPIFRQYAILYPVMKKIVDLGNYYDVVKMRKQIMMSMQLPISHPNYMPVTRDLSESKRQAILEWLSSEKPLIGRSRDFYTLENLRKHLQTAIQIEFSTIPPYLTALATIKENYNNDIRNILKTVIVQEMVHMTLAANLLNAIGGKPVFFSKKFNVVYPTSLPGGVHPNLVVPIQKLSIGLIQNIFMKIEQPELSMEKHFELMQTFQFQEKKKPGQDVRKKDLPPDAMVDQEDFPCLDLQMKELLDNDLTEAQSSHYFPSGPDNKRKGGHVPWSKNDFTKQHNTIGKFYKHILNILGYITNCGTNDSIFTGDPSRQVNFVHGSLHGNSLKVTDFSSAVRAIKTIVEQGEGSSPCNPLFWSNGTVNDLSHYFLFYSIVEKRQIKVMHILNDAPMANSEDEEFAKICGGKYSFKGPRIIFDPDGVWPMVTNPKLSIYKKGSIAYNRAIEYNKVHTRLLKSLHQVFNGHSDELKDAIGIMYSQSVHLKKLIRTPIDPDGDSEIGPNAGPTFDFTP